MNILITGSRSARTFKLLKFFEKAGIFLADYGEAPLGATTYHFISLGEKNEEIIAHNLLNKCLDHHIDLLIPLHFFEIGPVAKTALLFEEFGIKVLLPGLDRLDQFLNTAAPLTGDLLVLLNGKKFLESDAKDHVGLSGVFYTDGQGAPQRLFTIEE